MATIISIIIIAIVFGFIWHVIEEEKKDRKNYNAKYRTENDEDLKVNEFIKAGNEENKKDLYEYYMYLELIDIKEEIQKERKEIKKMHSEISWILFIMLIPIIIGVVAFLININMISNALKATNKIFSNETTSVYRTDTNGNIYYDDPEYYGQDVDNTDKSTYYEYDPSTWGAKRN